jgi:negative modulator of initiation of replication
MPQSDLSSTSSRFWENRARRELMDVRSACTASHRRRIAFEKKSAHVDVMKNVELNDEAFEALQRLAAAKNLPPSEILAALLGANRPLAGDNLLFYLTGPAFNLLTDATERYLALLAWVARNYACDFADYISHQESARRYLMLSRDEVNDVRTRNHARQIDGTQFWAVLTIDAATKGRFVRRLLEFVGCHDETVTQAVQLLGLATVSHSLRLHRVA